MKNTEFFNRLDLIHRPYVEKTCQMNQSKIFNAQSHNIQHQFNQIEFTKLQPIINNKQIYAEYLV